MTEIKLFPMSHRRSETEALASELSRLDEDRRMSRWRSAMEQFCRKLDELGVTEEERRRQVSGFSAAVRSALYARLGGGTPPDDAA